MDTIHGLVEAGFLKATSVGFAPSTFVRNKFGGVDYQAPVELLEISVVSLPANAQALLERGCNTVACQKWLRGESSRAQWNNVMRVGGFSTMKEATMPRWNNTDIVLELTPSPLSRHRKTLDLTEAWRVASERQREKHAVIMQIQSRAVGNAGSRLVTVRDPEAPGGAWHIPAGHNDPDAADLIRRLIGLL